MYSILLAPPTSHGLPAPHREVQRPSDDVIRSKMCKENRKGFNQHVDWGRGRAQGRQIDKSFQYSVLNNNRASITAAPQRPSTASSPITEESGKENKTKVLCFWKRFTGGSPMGHFELLSLSLPGAAVHVV